jgi:adenylylsulfate kinase-like enzyme
MVIWITGRKGSYKTTTANRIAQKYRKQGKSVLVLDGDELRSHFPCDFSDEGRRENILRVAHIAAIAEAQGIIVICALISPKKIWRQEARKLFKMSYLIYLQGGYLWPGTNYEEPVDEENILHTVELLL